MQIQPPEVPRAHIGDLLIRQMNLPSLNSPIPLQLEEGPRMHLGPLVSRELDLTP